MDITPDYGEAGWVLVTMFIVGCKPPIKSLRLLVACSLIPVCGAAAGASTTLAHLPNTGVNAVKVDASGNIYIAGFQGPGVHLPPTTPSWPS